MSPNTKKKKIKIFRKSLFDKFSFFHIMMLWFVMIFIFGVYYFLFADATNFLMWAGSGEKVVGLWDAVYYSFVAASNGFGDIVAYGYFRQLAVAEIILGIFVVALLISKILSIKQDIILDEIYEISFQEKIIRLRSSLLLFRQNIGNLLADIEHNAFSKRKISDIEMHLDAFRITLKEIKEILSGKSIDFVKKIDTMNTGLLLNSLLTSLEKLTEIIEAMHHAKIDWKNQGIVKDISLSMELVEEIISIAKNNKNLHNANLKEIEVHYERVKQTLEEKLN